ncbi:hypothetical protein OIN60_19845 [Paenibacillus sp. P96]|uniref:Tail fiber protein n=1 Tax=Paenibacillus zeirhizosphaerae TaxID=2987519 RepID=A0ABT9FWU5_9BACL|nr:hypothetical protein [Paenibacillus sp. P96]MDP4098981.1 hypothetical protein [Paenibacillus sp. P96]
MSENTPKLDLLMKDPTLDGHEYFNVKTMMNDNWEKIDQFAGDAKASIESLEDRLNTKAEEEVVLNGGVQIVDAVKAAPFNLTGLKGRTLVNLLGRLGGMESLTGIGRSNATTALDASNKTIGSYSLKVTTSISPASDSGIAYIPMSGLKVGGYYVLIADGKNGNASTGLYVGWGGGFNPGYTDVITATDKFTTVWKKIQPNVSAGNIDLAVNGAVGQYGYFDAVRVYEISSAEYAALDSMTSDQVAAKYPYVDSVTPVRNPYAIRYGENLFPTFYERRDAPLNGASLTVNSPYNAQMTTTATNQYVGADGINIKPGCTITLSVGDKSSLTWGYINEYDRENTMLKQNVLKTLPAIITLNENTVSLGVFFGNGESVGFISVTDPMLNIGSEALPFVPREDALLALQTDLYADPVTGANADSVFEQSGQYFKAKKWQRLVLDGSQNWIWSVSSYTGYKLVQPSSNGNYEVLNNPVNDSGWLVKYDGKLLSRISSGVLPSSGDQQTVTGTYNGGTYNAFNLTISNADSGWGDNYTPTPDEIKAYFLGWKMVVLGEQIGNSVYNGTGTKGWSDIVIVKNQPTSTNAVSTLPTTPAARKLDNFEIDYYELVYQLATPTVEPIVSEGQLTFNEGSNQVEVGTGIVLREAAKPQWSGGQYWINGATGASSRLNNKPLKILQVYKNGKKDLWSVIGHSTGDQTSYGLSQAAKPAYQYDPSAAYSATYLMLATSPVQTITGTYAGNEKSLLEDLVDSVTHQEIRLAAVENKKAEKDSPVVWIRPTLLYGWIGGTAMFTKLENGLVVLRGVIQNGTTNAGTLIFQLPAGFRPSQSMEIRARSYNGSGDSSNSTIIINPDGKVIIQNVVYSTLWLDGISFVAEQ